MYSLTVAATALLATLTLASPAENLERRYGNVCSKDALASTLSSSKYVSEAKSFCSVYIKPTVTVKQTKLVSVTSSYKVTPAAKTTTVVNTVTSTKVSTSSASITSTLTSTKTNLVTSTVQNTITSTSSVTSTLTVYAPITQTSVIATSTSKFAQTSDNTHYHKRAVSTPKTNSAGYPTFIAATYPASRVSSSCSCLITASALKPTTISTTVVSTSTIKQTSTAAAPTVTVTIVSTTTKAVVGATVTRTLSATSTVLQSSTIVKTASVTITQKVTSTIVQSATRTTVLSTTSVLPSPQDVYCNVEGVTNGANLITDGWDIAETPADCMGLCRGAGNCVMMHFGCADQCYCGLYSSNDLDQSYYMGSGGFGNKYSLWDAQCDVEAPEEPEDPED